MTLAEWLKAKSYTEVPVYSTDTFHQTMVDAASYFAMYWWNKPRDIEVVASGIPEDAPGMFFQVKNGLAIYRIAFNSKATEYNVYRYDKVQAK